MRKLLAILAILAAPAQAQQPNGTINAPIYATGYISQVGGTNVTTTIKSQLNHPTNLNIYTTDAISSTWTIKLPNPAFEGQILSFNCGAAVNAISVISSDGSSIDSTLPVACSLNTGFTIQFDQRSNIWRNIGSNNTSTFKPFTGVASQWPWQLNADGSWTTKQPQFSDLLNVSTQLFGSLNSWTASQNFSGGAIIPFTQSDPGAIATTLDARSKTSLLATDFGAIGDNTANNTTTLQAAIAAAQSNGKTLYIPGGPGVTYKTDLLTYAYFSNPAALVPIICQPGTTIAKATADGTPILQIGSPSQSGYLGPVKGLFSGCNFVGIAGNTPNNVVSYDLADVVIDGVSASGASEAGWKSYGGISNVWNTPRFTGNGIGIEFTSFTRAGGGVPNNNVLNQPFIIDNSVWGIYFENGQNFVVNQPDIEGNGNGGSASGGVYCAPASTLLGCTLNGGWYELQNGRQGVWFNGGNNVFSGGHINNNPSATYDVYISAGSFTLANLHCGARTYNVYDAGATGPNALTNMSDCPNWHYTPSTTRIDGLPNVVTNYSIGNMTSGTLTLDMQNGPQQSLITSGAWTLAPPSQVGQIDLEIYNGASAGTITTSGFSKVIGAYATTNNYAYVFRVTKTTNYSLLEILPLQ